MCDGRVITAHDLSIVREMAATGEFETLGQAHLRAEREAILVALQRVGGNAWEAAGNLAVSRATLCRLLGKHGRMAGYVE